MSATLGCKDKGVGKSEFVNCSWQELSSFAVVQNNFDSSFINCRILKTIFKLSLKSNVYWDIL